MTFHNIDDCTFLKMKLHHIILDVPTMMLHATYTYRACYSTITLSLSEFNDESLRQVRRQKVLLADQRNHWFLVWPGGENRPNAGSFLWWKLSMGINIYGIWWDRIRLWTNMAYIHIYIYIHMYIYTYKLGEDIYGRWIVLYKFRLEKRHNNLLKHIDGGL